jgi:hypothetical protein
MPLISESTSASQSIGVGMFKDPCLMGVFPLSASDIPKVVPIKYMISFVGSYDPLEIESLGDTMLLPPTKLSYSAIQSASEFVDTVSGTSSIEELDQYFFPQWAKPLSLLHDLLNDTLPSDEAILEVMTLSDQPWEDSHHRSRQHCTLKFLLLNLNFH